MAYSTAQEDVSQSSSRQQILSMAHATGIQASAAHAVCIRVMMRGRRQCTATHAAPPAGQGGAYRQQQGCRTFDGSRIWKSSVCIMFIASSANTSVAHRPCTIDLCIRGVCGAQTTPQYVGCQLVGSLTVANGAGMCTSSYILQVFKCGCSMLCVLCM